MLTNFIIVSAFLEDEKQKQELITKVVAKTREVFCPLTGILHIPRGNIGVIQDFRIASNPVGGPRITILLHNDGVTAETLEKVKKSFKELELPIDPFHFFVAITNQPKESLVII